VPRQPPAAHLQPCARDEAQEPEATHTRPRHGAAGDNNGSAAAPVRLASLRRAASHPRQRRRAPLWPPPCHLTRVELPAESVALQASDVANDDRVSACAGQAASLIAHSGQSKSFVSFSTRSATTGERGRLSAVL